MKEHCISCLPRQVSILRGRPCAPELALAQSPIRSALLMLFSEASISSMRLLFADFTTFTLSSSESSESASELSSLFAPFAVLRNLDPNDFLALSAPPASLPLSSLSLSSLSLSESDEDDESLPAARRNLLPFAFDAAPPAPAAEVDGLAALRPLSLPLSSSDDWSNSSSDSSLDSLSLPPRLKNDILGLSVSLWWSKP